MVMLWGLYLTVYTTTSASDVFMPRNIEWNVRGSWILLNITPVGMYSAKFSRHLYFMKWPLKAFRCIMFCLLEATPLINLCTL